MPAFALTVGVNTYVALSTVASPVAVIAAVVAAIVTVSTCAPSATPADKPISSASSQLASAPAPRVWKQTSTKPFAEDAASTTS